MTRYYMMAAAIVVAAGGALAATPNGQHVMVVPGSVQWGPAPASLPAGAQAAVLEGDPAKAGAFTLRIRMPDGYTIPPHWHAANEHITVLAGVFVMASGDTLDRSKGHDLPAGAFAMMPAGTRHFAWTRGETIVQLHGTGPWGITYVNATDDPRKSK